MTFNNIPIVVDKDIDMMLPGLRHSPDYPVWQVASRLLR